MITLNMNIKKVSPGTLFIGSLLLLYGSDYLYNAFLGLHDFLKIGSLLKWSILGLLALYFIETIAIPSKRKSVLGQSIFNRTHSKNTIRFVVLMISFELIQVMMNSNDIFLINSYFNVSDAHLYGSMAFIGRLFHISIWLFVLLALPGIMEERKKKRSTRILLISYMWYAALLSILFIGSCYVFPDEMFHIVFGEIQVFGSDLLWQYALVSALFMISKVFTYYFLYLEKYTPAIMTAALGMSQTLLIMLFHSSITMVIQMQLIVMISLLVAQLLYFAPNKN